MYAMAGRGFSNPVDMALGSDGVIYVLSRGNPAQAHVAVRVSVCTIDEEDLGQFAAYGAGDGELTWPTSIAIDGQDRIFISDEYRNDVQVFHKSGTFLFKWGSLGAGEGDLNRPSGLAIARDGNVVVVDHLNHRVQIFTPEGTPIVSWGTLGSGDGEFNLPWGVAVDGQGLIYVADWNNNRIQKFTPEGRFLASFGSFGSGDGQFNRPSGVAVDQEGKLYVADRGNDRVQVLTANGSHIATLIGDARLSKWGEEFLTGNQDLVEGRAEADLEPESRFWIPTAVKVTRDGKLLVLEAGRHRIQVYEAA
jgi:DNA-binding beta-propeller fold protein YncE